MVEKYLEKYYNLLLEKKVNLEENLELHRIKLEKYYNRIQELNNDSNESLLGFSPHIVDVDESEKAEKYQTLVDSCKNEIELIENSILDVKEEIKQLFSEIQYLKEEERKKIDDKKNEEKMINDRKNSEIVNKKQTDDFLLSFSEFIKICEYEKYNIKNKIYNNIIQKLKTIQNRIDLSYKIFDLDPARCKIELNAISNIMEQNCFNLSDSLYSLNSMFSDEDEKVEVLINDIFSNLEKSVNHSIPFSLFVEESIDKYIFVMKYHIVSLINKLCFILINEFRAEKFDMKLCNQNEKVCITVKYIGDKFSLDDSRTDSLNGMENNILENISDVLILKKELEFLSAKILESDFENDENIISIVFPLKYQY